MSREIEFRAWNTYHRKMFKVYGIDFCEGLVYCESESGTRHTFGMIDIVLMQFTGLKDKNGVKIFEGDIVSYDTTDSLPIIAKVLFNESCLYWKVEYIRHTVMGDEEEEMDFTETEAGEYQVIGNIHENASLLEGK